MTPITKETLEAAGFSWEGDRYIKYNPDTYDYVQLDHIGRKGHLTIWVTSIEQIAEVCRLSSAPTAP